MKKLLSLALISTLLFTVVTAVAPVATTPVLAQEITDSFCDPNNDGDRSDAIDPVACGISDPAGAQNRVAEIFANITQTLVFVVGGLSVIVIVIGGLMYVLSGGDGNNTKRAKDAIQYAIIGLVVALIAQGLVSFVLRRL